ncbi:MAG TPA: thrombospondin type 3 repeat-containing protein [Polyangiaceae bacterium]
MNAVRRRCVLVLGAWSALCWGSLAHAKQEFPSEIQSDLVLTYQVPCSVCHVKGNTGSSTVNTPMALSLRERGLSGDRQSLVSAFLRLKTDGVDSDGDGKSDVAELHDGTDPNSSADANIDGDQEPGYGCGGSAPKGRNGGQAVIGAVALAWLLSLRRRARS